MACKSILLLEVLICDRGPFRKCLSKSGAGHDWTHGWIQMISAHPSSASSCDSTNRACTSGQKASKLEDAGKRNSWKAVLATCWKVIVFAQVLSGQTILQLPVAHFAPRGQPSMMYLAKFWFNSRICDWWPCWKLASAKALLPLDFLKIWDVRKPKWASYVPWKTSFICLNPGLSRLMPCTCASTFATRPCEYVC